MTKVLLIGLLSCLSVWFMSVPASSGPNANAKILIHLATPTVKAACERAASHPSCTSVASQGVLYPVAYDAYVVVADVDSLAGVAGLQFGISYNGTEHAGLDVFGWYSCADLEFPQSGWPASGTGTILSWISNTHCARPSGAQVIPAGYFYCAAYDADVLSLTTRPVDNCALVICCSPTFEDSADVIESGVIHFTPSHLGTAVFSTAGTTLGNRPCGN